MIEMSLLKIMNKKIKWIFPAIFSSLGLPLIVVSCEKKEEEKKDVPKFDYSLSKYAKITEEANDPNIVSTIDLDIPDYSKKAIVSPKWTVYNYEKIKNVYREYDDEIKKLNLYKTKDQFINYLKEKSLFYSKNENTQKLKNWFDDFQTWSNKTIDFDKYDVLEIFFVADQINPRTFIQLIWDTNQTYLIFSERPPFINSTNTAIEISTFQYFIFVEKNRNLNLDNLKFLGSEYISKAMWNDRKNKILQIEAKDFDWKKYNNSDEL